ncbi:MAG: hypothetical protein ABIS30_08665, partial [Gallionella sp.]
LQGQGECVPCMEEGCERHNASLSDCLQHLPVANVIAAIQDLSEKLGIERTSKKQNIASQVDLESMG